MTCVHVNGVDLEYLAEGTGRADPSGGVLHRDSGTCGPARATSLAKPDSHRSEHALVAAERSRRSDTTGVVAR